MANKTGIAITIRAFLVMGKSFDEQFAAMTLIKDAHATGDYSKVLAAAIVDEVKSEQKTRRFEDAPTTTGDESHQDKESGEGKVSEDNSTTTDASGLAGLLEGVQVQHTTDDVYVTDDLTQPGDKAGTSDAATEDGAGVPEFVKAGRKKANAGA